MISFIITAYNRYDELKALFASLERQTLKNFECLIVDDNSSDLRIEELCNEFLKQHGGTYIKSDVTDARRKELVRYAENINYVLSVRERIMTGDLIGYLCDDAELADDYVETVLKHFYNHPDHLAGYVSEVWLDKDGQEVNRLWYNGVMVSAFCALDHSQVIHRVGYEPLWATHPHAWRFADGIAFERLLGRVGVIHPIGDERPRVFNKILDTSVCRQPIEQALEKLK